MHRYGGSLNGGDGDQDTASVGACDRHDRRYPGSRCSCLREIFYALFVVAVSNTDRMGCGSVGLLQPIQKCPTARIKNPTMQALALGHRLARESMVHTPTCPAPSNPTRVMSAAPKTAANSLVEWDIFVGDVGGAMPVPPPAMVDPCQAFRVSGSWVARLKVKS